MMHFLSVLFFVIVLFGAGFCLGYTVRMNLQVVLAALRGERHGPRA